MPSLTDYTRQSPYSDPREYADLLATLPTDQPDRPDQAAELPKLAVVVRNLIRHYRAEVPTSPERLAEVDNRWIDRLLACDRTRFDTPLDVFRPEPDRVVGCCRDFTLLTVAALRARGVPARSRVGFAAYFAPDFHHDHVITEYWDGRRWVFADTQITRDGAWPPFDPLDLELGPTVFETAAQVWTRFRRGEIDVNTYGVDPNLPLRGDWFVRNYVIQELAHRQRDELLLWDTWGVMSLQFDGDHGLIDDVAALLLAADGGDEAAEQKLADWYAADSRLHPGDRVISYSPVGLPKQMDLHARSLGESSSV
jgi:hypothetical protein